MPGPAVKKIAPYAVLAAAPALILICGLTLAALLEIAKESLGFYGRVEDWGMPWRHYADFLFTGSFWQALIYSLKTAFVSSALAMALGICLAQTRGRGGRFLWPAIIAMSYVSAAVAVYDAFGDRGFLARIINVFLSFDGRLNIVHDQRGLGIIILYVFKAAPFTLIACDTLFSQIKQKFQAAAAGLGLTPFEFFIHLLMPIGRRSLLAVWMVIFIFVLFSYEGFYFLGVSVPSSLGELCLRLYTSADLSRRAEAMALSGLMITAALICTFIFRKAANEKNFI